MGQAAFAECKPLPNVDEEVEWRREMVRELVEKAVARALNLPARADVVSVANAANVENVE
jgi:hypothetical protein